MNFGELQNQYTYFFNKQLVYKQLVLGWQPAYKQLSLGWKLIYKQLSLGWKLIYKQQSLGWKPVYKQQALRWKPVYKQLALGWQIAKQLSELQSILLSNNKNYRLKKSGAFHLQ